MEARPLGVYQPPRRAARYLSTRAMPSSIEFGETDNNAWGQYLHRRYPAGSLTGSPSYFLKYLLTAHLSALRPPTTQPSHRSDRIWNTLAHSTTNDNRPAEFEAFIRENAMERLRWGRMQLPGLAIGFVRAVYDGVRH